MAILAWIVVGLVAGWLASMLMGAGGYSLIGDVVIESGRIRPEPG